MTPNTVTRYKETSQLLLEETLDLSFLDQHRFADITSMRNFTMLLMLACALACIEAFGMYRYGPLDMLDGGDPTKFSRKVKSANGFDLSHVSAYPKHRYLENLFNILEAVGRRK